MSTRSRIARKTDSGYESIYCHFDGYPSGVGKTLLENYQSPEKIEALMQLGDLSSLGAEIGAKHPFGHCPEGECNSYGRDRGEQDIESRITSNLAELISLSTNSWADYTYVFEDGQWKILDDETLETLTVEKCQE